MASNQDKPRTPATKATRDTPKVKRRKAPPQRRMRLGVLAVMLVSCAEAEQAPAERELVFDPTPKPALEVNIGRPSVPDSVRFPEELRGLTAALLELGFSELPGVVPHVDGQAPPRGLRLWPRQQATLWRASVQLDGDEAALDLQLSLCPERGGCVELTAAGPRAELPMMVADVLREAAWRLERSPTPDVMHAWGEPLSADPYAVLLSGRAAASWYGFTPAIAEEDLGDPKRDPIRRAALVDPFLPTSAWVLARRDAARGKADLGRSGLSRGLTRRADSPALQALDASLHAQAGRPVAALESWTALTKAHPEDLRFVLPLAEAALAAGRPERAEAVLDGLPAWQQEDEQVLRLRVRVAGDQVDDLLLARWQVSTSDDPEPVRRRVSEMLEDGRYREALALIDELSRRGAEREAAALAVPLALGAGQHEQAQAAAAASGQAETAERIAARQAITTEPAALLNYTELSDPVLLGVRGRALLADGQVEAAHDLLAPALEARPDDAELLAVWADVLDTRDLPEQAAAARAHLRWVDPPLPQP